MNTINGTYHYGYCYSVMVNDRLGISNYIAHTAMCEGGQVNRMNKNLLHDRIIWAIKLVSSRHFLLECLYKAKRVHQWSCICVLHDMRYRFVSHYYSVLTPLKQWWKNRLSSRALKCLVPFPACCQQNCVEVRQRILK